ncbi:hypothetical protein [Paenibacillus sp. DMB5]|uniref:hypothetical protein n=1 Tax=Paenibacillus sp. DMB5 TaxID=1780103 RepID=UPI000AFD49C9|nr:hypothetical protein [Paenibacillus sp. DMB5]
MRGKNALDLFENSQIAKMRGKNALDLFENSRIAEMRDKNASDSGRSSRFAEMRGKNTLDPKRTSFTFPPSATLSGISRLVRIRVITGNQLQKEWK